MATPLICLKISPENVKQLSVKTSSAKRSSVSVEGSLTVRWSKKYLSAKSPSLFGITVYREVMSMVKRNLLLPGKLNCFKMFPFRNFWIRPCMQGITSQLVNCCFSPQASVLCDMVVLYVLQKKYFYREKKYLLVDDSADDSQVP